MIKIRMKLRNEFGEFTSEEMTITEDQYLKLVEASKSFYLNGGYEMHTDNGFMIFSPEIVKKSILSIEITKKIKNN